MTLTVTHNFVSPIADQGDPTLLGPNEWNDTHAFAISPINAVVFADSLTSLSGDADFTWVTGTGLTIEGTITLGLAAALTASNPAISITQTWNNVAVAFTAIKANITDTASAATSLFIDLQQNGTTFYGVGKYGASGHSAMWLFEAGTPVTTSNYTFLKYGNDTYLNAETADTGVYLSCGDQTPVFGCGGNGSTNFKMKLHKNSALGWTDDSADGASTMDTKLWRDAANIIAQRNSTTPQAFRVYNTFTSSTNYERGIFDWDGTSNVLTIGTEKGSGGGSTCNLQFVVDTVNKLDFGVTTAAKWTTPVDFVANALVATGDPGGVASTNTLSNVNSTTISTGVGSVRMSTANPGTNTGWLKCYVGTQVAWIPCWTTNAP